MFLLYYMRFLQIVHRNGYKPMPNYRNEGNGVYEVEKPLETSEYYFAPAPVTVDRSIVALCQKVGKETRGMSYISPPLTFKSL